MRDKWKAIHLQIMELLLEVPCAEFMNTVNRFSLIQVREDVLSIFRSFDCVINGRQEGERNTLKKN